MIAVVEPFEGHDAAGFDVPGLVDFTEPAGTGLLEDLIEAYLSK